MVSAVGSYQRSTAVRRPAAAAAQAASRIVGHQQVVLQIEADEDFHLEAVALEAPAGHELAGDFAADDRLAAERAGIVAVVAARHHRLKREALGVEPAG